MAAVGDMSPWGMGAFIVGLVGERLGFFRNKRRGVKHERSFTMGANSIVSSAVPQDPLPESLSKETAVFRIAPAAFPRSILSHVAVGASNIVVILTFEPGHQFS